MEKLICKLRDISLNASGEEVCDEIRRAVPALVNTMSELMSKETVSRLLFYHVLKTQQILIPEEAWRIANDRDERGNIKISPKCWWLDAHYHMNFIGKRDPYSIYRIDEYWNGARFEWIRFHFNAPNRDEPMTVVTYHSSGRVKIDNPSIRAVYDGEFFSLMMPECWVGDQYLPAFILASEDDVSVQFERNAVTLALFRKHQED